MTKRKRMTMADVRREAAKYEAEVSRAETKSRFDVTVDAPLGKVWAANGCHCICASHVDYGPEYRHEVCRSLMEDMACGLEECDDPDCDVCHPID